MRQLRQVFARYVDRKIRMVGQGTPLMQPDGTSVGHVDRVELRDGRLWLVGWADAKRVLVSQNGLQAEVRPDLVRDDVLQANGRIRTPRPGFLVSLPYRAGPVALALEMGSDVQVFSLPALQMAKVRKERRRHLGPFLMRVLWALPLAIRYKLCRSPVHKVVLRQQIKRRLDLNGDEIAPTSNLNTGLFVKAEASQADLERDVMQTGITIILPVYNALDLVQECLARVVQHTDLDWHLVVIEDCSTDTTVRPWLADWVQQTNANAPGRITLIENPENRGFIGSVNSGFNVALERGNPVVLLNSDAFVPVGWASRLIRPLLSEPDAASVTPMSNDAEIFGAPLMCVPVALSLGEADVIDKTAATFTRTASFAEAPTGVGFCMAMHIDYLRRYPQFDIAFGRGYGEEVDWCQKVRADGGRHLGLASLYVEHRGGQSFGNAEKLKNIAAASKLVTNRYETYDADVQDFVRHDPLHTPRLALALAWAAARTAGQGLRLPVYMAHDMGGGAELYLQQRIADDLAEVDQPDAAVILRMGGPRRFQLEVYSLGGVTAGGTDDFSLVKRLLEPALSLHLVYSNGVGDPDPVALPGFLLDMKRGAQDSLEVLMHDFFPLSPSFNLLNAHNRFEGVPDASIRSPVHEVRRPDGTLIKLAEWRAAWGALLNAADEVRVFSNDGAAHVKAAYPEITPTVVPHTMSDLPARIPDPQGRGAVIGVLGNIGLPKGAPVLKDMGEQVEKGGLVLIGNIDPAYNPGPNVIVHGEYTLAELETLARKYGISCWLIPSICPETFSYTTQECLATGLPVWCFDLGAQAEAVSRAVANGGRGGILPLEWVGQPRKVVERLTKPAIEST
ncbi:glycosyl transferase [Thalassorhabdomicrobium marinisediminis]|uniref:Glycosyl transferase n=1 Tax=Thalassorhabdomicrobium marinisediminis TaxID=2170577 RepID=A0A2T7FSV9_9RHOB|nr:glycosyl transferase [Thalassorhabdomicrobium marinisediminis]